MITAPGPTLAYLVKTMAKIWIYAVKRSPESYHDLPFLFFMFVAPLFYMMKFRGVLSTPIGRVRIKDQESMRSFTYGLFKTRFWYMRKLRDIAPGHSSFHT